MAGPRRLGSFCVCHDRSRGLQQWQSHPFLSPLPSRVQSFLLQLGGIGLDDLIELTFSSQDGYDVAAVFLPDSEATWGKLNAGGLNL